MAQIASEDYDNLLIYLHIDTVTSGFDPALMQKEHRTLRRLYASDERKYDPMVSFTGNEDKGGGKKTPRSTRLRAGVKIVPYDTGAATQYSMDILNEILNVPDGLADQGVFDRSGVAANVDIDKGYDPVEVIEVETGGGGAPTVEEIADAVWDEQLGDHQIAGSVAAQYILDSYQGMVVLTASGSAGTAWPIGTAKSPVNNIADAKTIAANIGSIILHLDSDFVITTGVDISGYSIRSHTHSKITLNSGAITFFTHFVRVQVEGVFNGGVIMEGCTISAPVSNFYGLMDRCVFADNVGVISDNTENAVFLDCYTGDITTPPTIDCGGDGAKISMRGITGAVLFANKTAGTTLIFIDLYSARVGFASSITAGSITVRGIGYIYLDDSSGATFDLQGLMSKATISVAVWDEELTRLTHNLPNSAGRRLRALSSSTIYEDDVVSATANTITLVGASTVDGAYDPAMITITDGLGAGQTRMILQYIGVSRTAIIDRDWKTIPNATSVYLISAHPGREHVNEGLAQGSGGGNNTIQLNTLASSSDGVYVGQTLFLRSGTGEDQAAIVIAYNGTTKIATVEQDWEVNPDNTTGYSMLPNHTHPIAEVSSAIWDALAATYVDPGTMGEMMDEILKKAKLAAFKL